MIIVLYALSVLAVLALAATVYALVSARDGYEDETGFHPAKPDRPTPPASVTSVPESSQHKASLQPLLPDPLNPHPGW